MEIRLTLNVREEADGSLWAEVEELPGCFASGRDLDELMEAMDEAVTLYLQDGDVPKEELQRLAVTAEVVPLDQARRGKAKHGAAVEEVRSRFLIEA